MLCKSVGQMCFYFRAGGKEDDAGNKLFFLIKNTLDDVMMDHSFFLNN